MRNTTEVWEEEYEDEYIDLEQGQAYSSVGEVEREAVYCPKCKRLLGEVIDEGEYKTGVGFFCWKCKGMLRYTPKNPPKRKVGFV